jgi:2-phospho-L-lactate/phosphoenolpyruvate guanylyltransferase
MRTAAVLPVKRFAFAKQRLGASVEDPLRSALASAMVADVLLALTQASSVERTIVVTAEAAVAETAAEQGAIVLDDEAESGQSPAVTLGVRRALAERFERVLCVPGDCPALDPAEIDALLGAPPAGGSVSRSGATAGELVIVPDRHGSGTNGLLLTPPDAIAPSFGPGSCARHLELARAAGLSCRLERLPSLLLDVDTGEDLAALRERLAAQGGRASRTRAVLSRSERPAPVSLRTPA